MSAADRGANPVLSFSAILSGQAAGRTHLPAWLVVIDEQIAVDDHFLGVVDEPGAEDLAFHGTAIVQIGYSRVKYNPRFAGKFPICLDVVPLLGEIDRLGRAERTRLWG